MFIATLQTFIGVLLFFALILYSLFIMAYSGQYQSLKLLANFFMGCFFCFGLILFGWQNLFVFIIFILVYSFLTFVALVRFLVRRSQLKSEIIIPEFELKTNLKLYEIGALMDGVVTTKDLIAHFLNKKIRGIEPTDETEEKLAEIFELTGGFHKNLETLAKEQKIYSKTDKSVHIGYLYNDYSPRATRIVYEDLTAKNYFYFNPSIWLQRVNSWSVFILLIGIGLYIVLGYNILGLLSLIIGISIFPLATFLPYFAENFSKTIPQLNQVRGHKMYLKTVEKNRITKDADTFKYLVPYFISYNIREDLARKGIIRFDMTS